MADFTYATVFASAGFAGESFDIAAGYGLTYTPASGDAAFALAGSTITLTAGTWPAWFVTGKTFEITSGSALNLGVFTVVSVTGAGKILTVLEAVATEAAQTPVCNGSGDAGIIDVLLSVGNGALTSDAPLVLTSTGALTASRTLDITGLETETALEGGEKLPGRFFLLYAQNTDISASVSITVSSSATINGAASFAITNTGDYLFAHVADGVWRCSALARPTENVATLVRVPFTAADWAAGTANCVVIPQTGALGAGEVGPHGLVKAGSYLVQVINTDLTPDELVDVETQFDASTGDITLVKAKKAPAFNGVAIIAGTLD